MGGHGHGSFQARAQWATPQQTWVKAHAAIHRTLGKWAQQATPINGKNEVQMFPMGIPCTGNLVDLKKKCCALHQMSAIGIARPLPMGKLDINIKHTASCGIDIITANLQDMNISRMCLIQLDHPSQMKTKTYGYKVQVLHLIIGTTDRAEHPPQHFWT